MPIFRMKLVKNQFKAATIVLNVLGSFGFLVRGTGSHNINIILGVYWIFWVIIVNVSYIIMQVGDLIQIWGDIPLMVSDSFLLFTNLAFASKIVVMRTRREVIFNIIDEGNQEFIDEERAEGRDIINGLNQESTVYLRLYYFIGVVTTVGWIASAEKGSLPTRAWYPFDPYRSPVYELAYIHQSLALTLIATLHISMDLLITTLMAICRCRLRLLKLSLRTLCSGLVVKGSQHNLTREQENVVRARLRVCVSRHQAALQSADSIQACFTKPILVQFTVSMIIICVTAYELAMAFKSDSKNILHTIAMITYLLGMVLQVYLYCYQGDRLANESSEIAYAAFQCEWHLCSLQFRRALLVVMVRSRRVAQLTAGGFSTLSLSCFTSIIKASYTFFTVLQQVDD